MTTAVADLHYVELAEGAALIGTREVPPVAVMLARSSGH